MKKIMIMVVCCLFFLTGCKNSRLVCTATLEDEDFNQETKYIFTFANGKVNKATMKSTGTLLGEFNNEDTINDYKASAESYAEDYNKVEGITAQVSNSKNKVTLTVDIIAASLNDEDKEKYGLNSTREELKKEFEENKYTCK